MTADAAEAALRGYADSLAHGDLDRALTLINLPVMYVTPQGVAVLPDADIARVSLSLGVEQMRADGYDHTEFVGLTSRPLSPDLVAFTGTLVRVRADGEELNRVGFTYTLRQAEDGWKLVCGIIHDLPS
ncbi:MAG: hypothetical protein WAT66_08265 [Actinomycetota bacterium]